MRTETLFPRGFRRPWWCQEVSSLANPQLQARGHFVPFSHPLLRQAALMPGAPYVLSATPWQLQRPAPALGQHTVQVLGEIGIAPDEVARLVSAGVAA